MAYGILSGLEIIKEVKRGSIIIDPFSEDAVNGVSIDLRLGSRAAVFRNIVHVDMDGKVQGERFFAKTGKTAVLDSAKKNPVTFFDMRKEGFMLRPGLSYLMHTVERIKTDRYVPIIDGKSSIGRLFVTAHITAGFGDPGFDGQYTLEVVATHPIIIYPGMRFCQMRFHTIVGDLESYSKKGNYKGDLASGPVPSQSWKMFQKN